MLQNLINIEKEELLEKIKELKLGGYRFAAMTCENQADNYELTYHFDRDYEMFNVRSVVKSEDNVMSISTVYPAAFLIENEFQDLYGLTFSDLTIDYKGRLYLTDQSPSAPMRK